jgi:alkylation response protein AidB-like acyl-CoA dehydrogenase
MRFLWFPVGECEIVDIWHVSGLRGTGSNDFVVTNVFVPEERSFDAYNGQPAWPGALFQFPRPSLLSSCISSVMLGIARGAIETLVQLASVKIPAGSRGLLRERGAVQADIARAEALVQSARAWLFALFAEVAETCATGHAISLQQRARLRLASVNAGQSAAQAVDLICNAGGSSSIFTSSPLERFSRDVRAAAQNIAVTPITYEICGRVLLGMDPGTPRF